MISDLRSPNRPAPTWRQILNPIWLLSDTERNPAWTWRAWFLRNPAANLCTTALGICHCRRLVFWARGPGWTFDPDGGWNWGYSVAVDGWLPRPFVSWRGSASGIEIMSGWKTSGALSLLTLRRSHAPNAEPTG